MVNSKWYIKLFFTNHLPATSGDSATYEWAYDEYPEVAESLTTFEESRTDRTGGVHTGTCVVNAYEVDEDE